VRSSDCPLISGLTSPQDILQSTVVASLGHKSPREIFMGLLPTNPLKVLLNPKTSTLTFFTPPTSAAYIEAYTLLLSALSQMHRDVNVVARDKRRKINQAARLKHPTLINFGDGDYVMHATTYRHGCRWSEVRCPMARLLPGGGYTCG
jgi:hypothetical protein